MYSVVFYVPESHLEAVKTAVFAAGAGSIGDYQNCCWQVLGQGQFQPQAGSQPFIGQPGLKRRISTLQWLHLRLRTLMKSRLMRCTA